MNCVFNKVKELQLILVWVSGIVTSGFLRNLCLFISLKNLRASDVAQLMSTCLGAGEPWLGPQQYIN